MVRSVTRWTLLSLIVFSWPALVATIPIANAPTSFVFSTVGDFSSSTQATANLKAINGSSSNFVLALGDLSYGNPGTEQSWCNYVRSFVNPKTPFELVSGDHEDGGEIQNGLIDNFATCLPERLGAIGIYGKEYYFDYPQTNPIARFILISPALTLTYGNGTYPNGSTWNYTNAPLPTPHYVWLNKTIDQARSLNIPWVIVGMHKDCITSGVRGCEIKPELMNLLLSKKVDLILQGHEQSYQRSKQLACATPYSFTVSCVTNDGSSGTYMKGQGTVTVIDGTGGAYLERLFSTAEDRPYFAAWNNNTWGYSRYSITPDRIDQVFTPTTGSYTDSFSIVKSSNPVSASITGPALGESPVNSSTSYAASAAGGWQPYNYAWNYGDSSTGNGNPVSHSYKTPGTYIVGVTVRDANGQFAQAFMNMIVCAPVLTTINHLVGNQTSSLGGATYTGGGFKPGIPDKRDTAQPCVVNGNVTFVEIRNVRMLNPPISNDDCANYWNGVYCDTSFSIADPAYLSDSTCPVCYLHRLWVEIDQSWKSLGTAPGLPNVTIIGNNNINVDGFVYWDASHTTTKWHAYSGWELHPVVAWKLSSASTPITADYVMSNASPWTGTRVNFTATASGGMRPYAYAWLFADRSPSEQGNRTSHSFTTPGAYAVTLHVSDSAGQVFNVFHIVSVAQPDFSMSTIQNSIVLSMGQSFNLSITIGSLKGFRGNVTLTASLSPGIGVTKSWNSTTLLVQVNGTASVVLSIRTTSGTYAGSSVLTLAGSSGWLSHSTIVSVSVQTLSISLGGGRGQLPK